MHKVTYAGHNIITDKPQVDLPLCYHTLEMPQLPISNN